MTTPVSKQRRNQKLSSRQVSCGYPPPPTGPMTKDELLKAANRSRRGDDADNPLRRHDYDKHRQRVYSAKPMVDTSSPVVGRNIYTSPAQFNRSISNFVNVERENARMLQRIAVIMKSPPTVDNRLKQENHSINIRSQAREKQLLRIAFDNMSMYNRILGVTATYDRKTQLKEYDQAEKAMELMSYYPLFWKVSEANSGPQGKASDNAKNNPKPKVFLDLETDEESLGRITIELRADVVPKTAENFRCLCTGESGLSYKCSEIHRVLPGYLWQGGDVVGKDGRGGKSIYGDSFPDENYKLKHSEKGIVSMVNLGEKDTNGSQFLICAKKLSALDGVNVVVGKVVGGMGVLDSINDFVTSSGMMKKKIWIANCGSADDDNEEENEEEDDYEEDDPNDPQYEPLEIEDSKQELPEEPQSEPEEPQSEPEEPQSQADEPQSERDELLSEPDELVSEPSEFQSETEDPVQE